jgi:hypothetical protein
MQASSVIAMLASSALFYSVMVRTEHDDSVPIHRSFSIIVVPTDTPGYNILVSSHFLTNSV